MERNLRLSYLLSFFFHGWFWMGNWVFYYLSFGGYATVAMLDSGALLAGLIYEIPTGSLADLMGKKKTLVMSFLSLTIGNFLMFMSNNVWFLAFSLWFFVCLGYAFYSGTMEALLYDSLKSVGREDEFDKKMGTIGALRLLAMALSAVVGGFAYTYNSGLPYLLSAILSFFGLIVCFWLVEPNLDTKKYTIKTFFVQNTRGIKSLFADDQTKDISWYLVITGGLLVFSYNLLDDLLAIEYGFNPTTISWLFAVACLVAGVATYVIPRLNFRTSPVRLAIFSVGMIAVCLMVSPLIAMWLSAGLLMIRVIGESVYQNYSSVIVNNTTDSDVRATTLSSLSLLRNVPYALLGSFVGLGISFVGGAKNFAMWYGLVILIIVIFFGFFKKRALFFRQGM